MIPRSGIRKFFDLIASMEGVISLGVGEPDYVTPWCIREAAIYALEKGHTMYTSNYGLLELREALAELLNRRYNVSYDPESELLVTVGVSEALDLAMRAIVDPGDEIIIPDPGYVSYAPCVILAGGKVVPVPTYVEDDFKVRATAIQARVTPRTKAILLGYPNNPTGAVMTRDELLQIAQVARRSDLLVISDEIYDRLVYDGEHTCFASLPGMKERTILLGGFSKSYAMTGWRLGYGVMPKDLAVHITRLMTNSNSCTNAATQVAGIAALKGPQDDVDRMVAAFRERRDVIVKGLNEIPGVSCVLPPGAFYAFPNIKGTGMKSKALADYLLDEAGVACLSGTSFGAYGEGYLRLSYANSVPNIKKALERMAEVIAKLRK